MNSKKYIISALFLVATCGQTFAQDYYVGSVAAPGEATFSLGIADNKVVLPFAATTRVLDVQTNQTGTISCTESWCKVELNDNKLTITAEENNSTQAREAIVNFMSKDFHPYVFTIKQEAPLSFAVISDLHFGNSKGEGPMVKVPKALKNISSYKPLDAIFVAGDLTDGGSLSQYVQFKKVWGDNANFTNPIENMVFMMGNHDNLDGNGKTNYQNQLKVFNQGVAYPMNQYKVIKGYPFITISQYNSSNNDVNNSANGTNAYPKAATDSLSKWLAQAAKECPGKPIFVFTHVAPRSTCYSSWVDLEGDGSSWPSWSMKVLNPYLNKYPQVVVFAGHSHYPIGDPRSIHQGVNPYSQRQNYYTAINTGSTTYSEIHSPAVDAGIHPEKYEYVTEGMIITELPDGNIEIRRYDTYRNNEIDPDHRWILKAPFDGSQFEYADIRDADENPDNKPIRDGLPAPQFSDDSQLSINPEAYSATVRIPQAIDDNCVFRYGIVTKTNGVIVKQNYVFSQFYLTSDMPDTLSYVINGLKPETDYTVEVIAYDSYDNTSAPLTASFQTTADTDPANQVPERTGLFTFDDTANLLQSTEGTATLKPAVLSGSNISLKNTAAEANITSVEGPTQDNKAVRLPASSLFKILQGAAAKTYTIQMDIKVPATNSYNSLIQTSPTNSDDGDLFIYNGKIGVSDLGYGGSIVANTWHRILLVNTNGHLYLYVDGNKVNDASDSRWNLDAGGFYLFADDDGEVKEVEVAEIAYWNKALTLNQINNLGNIKTDNYISLITKSVTLIDDQLDFAIQLSGNVVPEFTLPDWVEAVDVTPTLGLKDYTFKAKPMEGYGSRNGEIIIKGDKVDQQTVSITQKRYQGVPDATGKWTFSDETDPLKGEGVAKIQAAKQLSTGITVYDNPADAGIASTNGPTADNKAILIPKGSYLKLTTSNQNETLSNYTIMLDIQPTLLGGYQSLLQTNTSNANDGDLFLNDTSIGLNSNGLGYNGKITPGRWNRIIFIVKDNCATIYLNGDKVGASTSGSQLHWEIQNSALLFADNDGEEGTMLLSELRFWNIALTDKQIQALGSLDQ